MSSHDRTTASAVAALWLLTGFFALQPLSTDFYLPALPGIATALDVSAAQAQLTLSVFVAMFAVGQLFIGPLVDRFGRRPVVIGGGALHLAGSVVCMVAPAIDVLIAGRVLQAFGACASVVGARAIVRDCYAPTEGARILARANSWMSIALLIGPILGGALESHWGFRGVFGALAVIGLWLVVAGLRGLPETVPQRNPHALRVRPLLEAYASIARTPTFWAYTFGMAASYGGLFAFLSGGPFVLIKLMGVSAAAFGLWFGVVVVGYIIGAVLCQRWSRTLGLRTTLLRAGIMQAVAGTSMLALLGLGIMHPLAVMLPQALFNLAHGLTTPCCQAGATAPFPDKAGSAVALMGFVQMAVAALVGVTISHALDHSALPLALGVAAGGWTACLGGRWLLMRWGGAHQR